MGYRRTPTIFTLTFDEYEGLEVRMRSLRIGKMRAAMSTQSDGDEISDEELDAMLDLITEGLVSWNLEDEGPNGEAVPVPADRAGVEDLDMDMLLTLISAWMDRIAAPSQDLGKGSDSGETSAVPLPPMVEL